LPLLVEIQEFQSSESNNENDSASIRYSNTDSGTDSDEESISDTNPTLREGSEFILLHPNRYLFNLDSESAIESVSGYIILELGRKVLQTALLDHVLPQNIISLNHARELGCIFEPQGDEKTISIDFGNGERKRSSSQVILHWGQGIHRATFPVRCFVYDCHIRNLVFGKEFLEKASYIWPDAKDTLESGK
jgi:hypothetical protein